MWAAVGRKGTANVRKMGELIMITAITKLVTHLFNFCSVPGSILNT